MAAYPVFSSTIATGANADTSVVDIPDVDYVAVFVKTDKALTGKLYVTPTSPRDTGFTAAGADWYKVGADLAIAIGNFYQAIQITGGGSVKLNLANASGTTATITAVVRPAARRPVH